MTAALVGNPNCGKSTLFNRLTHAHRRVGNYPGVTVRAARGQAAGGMELIDLPGVYTLRPHSADGQVVLDCLREHPPDRLIAMVDATNPQRGLYLTLQLLELGIPTVLALNLIDAARKNGAEPDAAALEAALGIPVIPISAARGEGMERLLACAARQERARPRGIRTDEQAILARYARVERLCAAAVPHGIDRARMRSDRIDRVLTHRIFAWPALAALLAGVFWLTFGGVGALLSRWMQAGLQALAQGVGALLTRLGVHAVVQSLVLDGILGGIGSVFGFLPVILTLFFLLALLEDSGYLARAAFILDAPMRRLGLSGRAAVALLLGFGCSVPAVLASRTAGTERERRRTVFLIPFMSCSAKIPIYAAFAAAFFPGHMLALATVLYAGGIVLGTALMRASYRRTDSDDGTFFLELPNYRLPQLKNALRATAARAKEFIQRAFTVILLATVLVWFLRTFDLRLQPAADAGQSLLAALGGALSVLFRPLGFSDWRLATALVCGFLAKESVISTLGVLAPSGLGALFCSQAAVMSFLCFTLLYTPCVAAVAAIRRELGAGTAAKVVAAQCAAAYLAAWAVYHAALLFIG